MNYRSSAGNVIYGDRYYYDSNARLVKVASDTNATRATYGYTNGQLTSATVGGTSYTYTYDGAGNLLSKTDGGTRHSYTYGSSVWADLLTAYDGQSITYDEIGNPESYYNGARMTMTWAKGRQLAALTKGSTSV